MVNMYWRLPRVFSLFVLLGVFCCAVGHAANLTYTSERSVGVGSASISITTDGTLGTLFRSNIVDWTISVRNGLETATITGPLSGNNSNLGLMGPALSATNSGLFFDFSLGTLTLALFQLKNHNSFYQLDNGGYGESLLASVHQTVGNGVTSSPRTGLVQFASRGISAPDLKQVDALWKDDWFNWFINRSGAKQTRETDGADTIGEVGCQITSIVNALLSLGSSAANTPRVLNDYLSTNGQYNAAGGVNPEAIRQLTGFEFVTLGNSRFSSSLSTAERIEQQLIAGNPVLVHVPWRYTSGKVQERGHWVLAYEKTATGYRVRDPGYSVQARPDILVAPGGTSVTYCQPGRPCTTQSLTPEDLRVLVPSGGGSRFYVVVHSPVEVLVTNLLGNRVGKLPSGATAKELVGSDYYLEHGLASTNSERTGIEPLKVLLAPGAPDSYKLSIRGTGDGPYKLDFVMAGAGGVVQTQTISGLASKGETVVLDITTDGSSIYLPHRQPGDLNLDGRVDMGDLNSFARYLKARTLPAKPGDPLDLNGDGKLTLDDLRLLLERILRGRR